MWFSNLQLYRLTKPFELSAEALAEQLNDHAFRPCASLDLFTYGWVPPMGAYGTELIHAANGHILICARKEEKILPAAVVREFVAEKVNEIQDTQGRPVRRKERDEIKDNVIHELLPKAFTRSTRTFAYISPAEKFVVVNATSAAKAEELLSYLRGSLGSLGVVPVSTRQAPTQVMTHWLVEQEAPAGFEVADECELREKGEDGSIIRCKRQDLASDEIKVHLDAGKLVTKLAIDWQEQLSCILNDDLSIKRLRFGEELLEKSKEVDADDVAAAFDNDFTLMTLELSRFIPRLIEVFGGENETVGFGE